MLTGRTEEELMWMAKNVVHLDAVDFVYNIIELDFISPVHLDSAYLSSEEARKFYRYINVAKNELLISTIAESTQLIKVINPLISSFLTGISDSPERDKILKASEPVYSEQVVNARKKFSLAMAQLREKKRELFGRFEDVAFHAANNLHKSLELAANQFFSNPPTPATYNDFKIACESAADIARLVLEQHRGWKKFLLIIADILLAAIAGIGTGIVKASTGHFFLSPQAKTNSINILNSIEQSVDDLSYPLI